MGQHLGHRGRARDRAALDGGAEAFGVREIAEPARLGDGGLEQEPLHRRHRHVGGEIRADAAREQLGDMGEPAGLERLEAGAVLGQ